MKKLILLAHLLYFSSSIFGQQYVWTTAPFDATSINLNGAAFESNGTLWGSSLAFVTPIPVGTEHIGKYDGNSLTIYTPSNTNNGLSSGGYKVTIDANNNKYILSTIIGQGNQNHDTLSFF